ncbi:GNAT family N-acetyltransferase [Devosia sp. SL43]|uniref:GNAT family N-acetyltransferase n=1 Tax=Devosia sp. SL43 TaxID=2806348 RepID=UPI001F169108|nr:GNAT family N-acetyltransferase [Devosia sp. SL43]UJW84147.1 GNAT family N-acetyltransferase [Devosia sp. SL43]
MTLKHQLPETVRTERLTLRAPEPSDVADLVAMANNANVFATTATLPFPYTVAHAEGFVANAAANPDVKAYVITSDDDRPMGVISFKLAAGPLPELGYWLGEPHWGKGIVTEAAIGLLAAVGDTPEFAEVDARVLESNIASVRVLEKAGFVLFECLAGILERHRGKPIFLMRWRRR